MIDTGDSDSGAAAPGSEVTDSSRKDQGMAEAPLSRLRPIERTYTQQILLVYQYQPGSNFVTVRD